MITNLTILFSILIIIAMVAWEYMPPAECTHEWTQSGTYRSCIQCKERQKLSRCDVGPMFWTIVPTERRMRNRDVHYI